MDHRRRSVRDGDGLCEEAVYLANVIDRRGVRSAMSEQRSWEEGRGEGGEGAVKLLVGRICGVLGILVGVGAIIAVFLGAAASIATGATGIVLGVVGYILGARRLGVATVVLGVAVLFLVGASSAGFNPGFGAPGHE
jgi:hypothetical protein